MQDTVTIGRREFQALHSAARAMFREVMKTENHSPDTLAFLQLLDAAIDAGHEALGTHRPSADQYIHMVGGIIATQAQNARLILEREGLLSKE